MKVDLKTVTTTVKRMVRSGNWRASDHASKDHPERGISKDHIQEVLKVGEAVEHDPLIVDGKPQFFGCSDRYKWVGEDQDGRVLQLKLVVEKRVTIIRANVASEEDVVKYRKEDRDV